MKIDFIILAAASLIPLLIGFLYYSKMLFGEAWMKATGLTEEKLKGGNMALTFGLTYVFSFFLAMTLQFITIHQFSIFSILANQPGLKDASTEVGGYVVEFFNKYGTEFRTFKHGLFHGVLAAITFALPIIGINALFERRSFKYVAIHIGYWAITLGLMGGVICQCAVAY